MSVVVEGLYYGCFSDVHVHNLPGKEYSKGDSRYAARESGIVSLEALTSVLEGPACILAA